MMGSSFRWAGFLGAMQQRSSLTAKMVLVPLILGVVVWAVLDYYQSRELRTIFQKQLNETLNLKARHDRDEFDSYVRFYHNAIKLIAAQSRLKEYLWDFPSQEKDAPVLVHSDKPPWLPPSSVMRSFPQIAYFLLYDHNPTLREIYQTVSEPLPKAFENPSPYLRQMSHTQVYLTAVEGMPFLIVSDTLWDHQEEEKGLLLMASPLNDEFLHWALGSESFESITALLDNRTGKVIASSQPDLIPESAGVEYFSGTFMITGKSFFDYGASDLQMQFVSLISVDRYDNLSRELLSTGRLHRVIIAGALLATFSLLMLGLSGRIRRLTSHVTDFTKKHLGSKGAHPGYRDQLLVLEANFNYLIRQVGKAQTLLKKEAAQNILLTRKNMEAEHERHLLDLLQAVTGILGVGVISHSPEGPRAANRQMQTFLTTCGSLDEFCQEMTEDRTIVLSDNTGGERIFYVSFPALMQREKITLVQDVTDRVQAERQLRSSLAEKETLLKEVHHRVKNNMQIISSLLYLQGRSADNQETVAAVRESRDRVRSMALIHEKLYHSGNLASIDFGDYIRSLTGQIGQSYTDTVRHVSINTDIEQLFVPVDKAVPCGLIINELVTNSLKHAFPEGAGGEIFIGFNKEKGNKVSLLVRDNGIGFSGQDEHGDSLGLTLIKNLSAQLEGQYEFRQNMGCEFLLVFEN